MIPALLLAAAVHAAPPHCPGKPVKLPTTITDPSLVLCATNAGDSDACLSSSSGGKTAFQVPIPAGFTIVLGPDTPFTVSVVDCKTGLPTTSKVRARVLDRKAVRP